jgi:hypothetical protein
MLLLYKNKMEKLFLKGISVEEQKEMARSRGIEYLLQHKSLVIP